MTNRTPSTRTERALLALDVAMMGLLATNLIWLLFDSLTLWAPTAWLFERLAPALASGYAEHVHPHFDFIDLIFISLFLTEFLARWLLQLLHERERGWFDYPLRHFYDLLGCVPADGLRLLRLLRVIAIVLRLQRLGWIQLNDWRIVRGLLWLRDAFVEEISDRVVLRVLSGVQDELQHGGPIEKRIVDDVIKPRREVVVRRIVRQIEAAVQRSYTTNREELETYIRDVVVTAANRNRELGMLDRVPVFGGYAADAIEHAIHDILNTAIAESVGRLGAGDTHRLIADMAGTVFDSVVDLTHDPDRELAQAIIEALDVIKAQVAVQRWRDQPSTAS